MVMCDMYVCHRIPEQELTMDWVDTFVSYQHLLDSFPNHNVTVSILVYICVYVCMYVCMYVRVYICMYVRVYVCVYVCVYVLVLF